MDEATALALAEGVSVQQLGEEEGAVVLRFESGQLYTCNDTTAEVLRLVAPGTSFGALIAALLAIFEVEDAELRADIAAILGELSREGLMRIG
jgi:hypothetical protein